jgi:hypothetical protein
VNARASGWPVEGQKPLMTTRFPLSTAMCDTHAMFVVDESIADAIRRAYDEGGELSAVVELRRHFPGITDNANARLCVRAIAGWQPLPPLPPKRRRAYRARSSLP